MYEMCGKNYFECFVGVKCENSFEDYFNDFRFFVVET